MRLRTAATLFLILLAVSGCASDDDGGDVSSGDTTATTSAATTSPSTSDEVTTLPPTTSEPATTASTAADTTTTTAGDVTGGGDPAITCDGGVMLGDVDGDGVDDPVAQVTDPATGDSTLDVCPSTATGGFQLTNGGQSELNLADVDGDGSAEIFYGGNQAMSRTVQIARYLDGQLVVVNGPEGTPLVLTDGFPEGLPPDGPRYGYGCDDHASGRVLVTVELSETETAEGPVISGTWRAFTLDGSTAAQVDSSEISSEGYDDLQTELGELVAKWTPLC